MGYKVNSERAVQFRKWATRVVEEFTIKGFAMDDERLKRGGSVLSDRSSSPINASRSLGRIAGAHVEVRGVCAKCLAQRADAPTGTGSTSQPEGATRHD